MTASHERGPAEIPWPIARAPRVLVVDDDEVIRRLIAANLTLEGFDVAMAAGGQDCLDQVSAIAPDVITFDVMTSRRWLGDRDPAAHDPDPHTQSC